MQSIIVKDSLIVNDSLIESFSLLSDKLYQLKLLVLFSDIPNKDQILELIEEIGNIEFKL